MVDVKTTLSECAHPPTEFNAWYKSTRLIGALDDLTRAYGSQVSNRTELSLRTRIVINIGSLICALICNKLGPGEITFNYKWLRCYIFAFQGNEPLYIARSSMYMYKPRSYILNTLLCSSLTQNVFIVSRLLGYSLDINLLHYGFSVLKSQINKEIELTCKVRTLERTLDGTLDRN